MGLWEVLVNLCHDNELLWIRHWKRAEEERVRDAEHRRGAVDTDRQRQRRRGCETRVSRQTAEAEPQIAPEVVQPPQSPRLTRRLANPSDVAEVLPRLASCLRRQRPAATRLSASSERWNWISSSSSDSLRPRGQSARRRA